MKITRRQFFLGAAAMASSTLLTGCPTPAAPPTKPGATGAPAAGAPQPTAGAAAGAPAKAGEPITISIIDVGGDLNSTKDIIENFKKKFPDKVKEIK
ncbi:MAG: twin-arginine translocation signal domain-containing protein, partial [Chloroflexota bacterium]